MTTLLTTSLGTTPLHDIIEAEQRLDDTRASEDWALRWEAERLVALTQEAGGEA